MTVPRATQVLAEPGFTAGNLGARALTEDISLLHPDGSSHFLTKSLVSVVRLLHEEEREAGRGRTRLVTGRVDPRAGAAGPQPLTHGPSSEKLKINSRWQRREPGREDPAAGSTRTGRREARPGAQEGDSHGPHFTEEKAESER